MYGIPNMKLDKQKVVLRRVEQMEAEGVTFLTNTEVGVNYPAEKLLKEFDAVVLCTGATKPRDLPDRRPRPARASISPWNSSPANTHSLLDGSHNGTFISAEGKDVIVIGGGDTGTDCVGTALRHGCQSLVQLEILPAPAPGRAPDNPWPEWPKVYRLDYGQEEAAAKFGADPRVYLTTAKKFDRRRARAGSRKSTPCKSSGSATRKGSSCPRKCPAPNRSARRSSCCWPWAFSGPEQPLLEAAGVERDPRTNVKAEFDKYATNLKGVFAAGDCRRGQSLVVWAFNEGRGAARECDRYLMGQTNLP